MTSFLFWNLNKKPIHDALSRLAHHYDVDVVLLAECAGSPSLLLQALNKERPALYHYAPGIGCKKIEVFTRFTSEYIRPVFEDSRWTIRHLNLPGFADILLGVVHLPSKLYFDEADQKAMCVRLATDLSMVKQQIGHSSVVLAGDFNMNPFEDGMVAADGLHGMMSQSIVLQESRIIQGRNYSFFYNPMWGFFGDLTPFSAGTYFYKSSRYKSFFWNIFDQVLVSPSLLNRFRKDKLKILDNDGTNNFLNENGEPNLKDFSDHLPILFELSL